ncbi:MAG: hypothetical protein JNM43_22245 [Planctomycetaceae bacterium]|nr:hypothetical protein [Planctomycetaceae bacterium]
MHMPMDPEPEPKEKNPYQVLQSPELREEDARQPTGFQIVGAVLLAVFAGAMAFAVTCFGTGIFVYEYSPRSSSGDPTGVIGFAIFAGIVVAGFTVYKVYGSLIQFWTTYRRRSAARPTSKS